MRGIEPVAPRDDAAVLLAVVQELARARDAYPSRPHPDCGR
ncbi:MAG: hypothetical protein ACRDRV_11555 [Pseudonocardiaceae bacterium]